MNQNNKREESSAIEGRWLDDGDVSALMSQEIDYSPTYFAGLKGDIERTTLGEIILKQYLTKFNPNVTESHSKMFFKNGYGISIVKTSYSYGGVGGLYECAMLYGTLTNHELVYPKGTSFEDNVVGYCDIHRVIDLIEEVQNYKEGETHEK